MFEKELQGRPAAPDAEKWLDYVINLKQEAPARYEDAAKFLATIISLTITIIFTAYEKMIIILPQPSILFIVLGLWLLALLFAFMTLSPHTYQVSAKEIDKIKITVEQIIKTKRRYFLLSAWLYFVPLASLLLFYIIFLLRSNSPRGVVV